MREPYKNLAWDDFRLVKAVAEARTLPAAASLLGLNHSTVFRRLGQIEAALGATLFERHRAGYAATAAGEEMAALAARLDADITSFTRKVAGQEVSPSGELRVTTTDTLLVHLLTPLLVRFREACPDVRLDIVVANEALNLSKRDADVAIRASTSPPETLVGRRVAPIAWALYGRPPASDGTSRGLAEADWVGFGEALGSLGAAKATAAQRHRVVYKVNTVLGLAEAVESGAGIGYVPCFIADARPGLVRLSEPRLDFADDLWLLTHPDLRRQPRVRSFLDFMGRELGLLRGFLAGDRPPPADGALGPETNTERAGAFGPS
ncbi:LysR family transcriptional regulator [Enterovirga sp.]|uniref:LysR family transcriptional regulator n=1 Tax=Enterovirga sp. TaxID=2026350 RepID=UPI0026261291|nr:LysR family transcriptional regulator [Enterovirga sp.]MDB5592351.1 lysR [Enterovirga sp.]